ncbi:L-serine ammonia-lyase [Pseudarthrobacter sp. P1]|uniref:L-serine ammonia-lyase n=1 Tax=Pseudarthrobacter sp. P1 TaxID=3418418 RepID=UPI003CEE39FF
MSCYTSATELFSIGIGPSSSHTVGPMRAGRAFAGELADKGLLGSTASITVHLYGSLGATGMGHGTPSAILAGLAGHEPETVDPAVPGELAAQISAEGRLTLLGGRSVAMAPASIIFSPRTVLPRHTNGMTIVATSAAGATVHQETYYSIGGGFVETESALAADAGEDVTPSAPAAALPYPYQYSVELMKICAAENLSVSDVAWANECALRPAAEVEAKLDAIWAAMHASIEAGLGAGGILPGVLHARRRAAAIAARLELDSAERETSHEWMQAFAIAVNEENAAGGRVVTAPTNGAAGIIPSVMEYFLRFIPHDPAQERSIIHRYLLVAAAIGSLYKGNASISGAEAGCQGEVGSACSMAAGAVCEILGGTPEQVENAAEIGMEHNLGLTCDPVAGLVQLPCIERNAIAAGKAVASARMALYGDGKHIVSLDTVIETMRQTGRDMSSKYKETSEGGLAVNVIEC